MELSIEKIVYIVKDVSNRIHTERTSKFKVDLKKATTDFYDTELGKAVLLVNETLKEPGYSYVNGDRLKNYIIEDYNLIRSTHTTKTYDRVLSYAILIAESQNISLTDLKKQLLNKFLC